MLIRGCHCRLHHQGSHRNEAAQRQQVLRKWIFEFSAEEFKRCIYRLVFCDRVHIYADFFPFVIIADGCIANSFDPGPGIWFCRHVRYILDKLCSICRYEALRFLCILNSSFLSLLVCYISCFTIIHSIFIDYFDYLLYQ